MVEPARAYLEHVAFHVRDIGWHIGFFRDVLGLGIRDIDGAPEAPRQVWLTGGLQLIATPDFAGPEGRFAHLGMMCEDVAAATEAGLAYPGVTHHEKGRNWLVTPDGVIVELLAAPPGSVAAALAVTPRG